MYGIIAVVIEYILHGPPTKGHRLCQVYLSRTNVATDSGSVCWMSTGTKNCLMRKNIRTLQWNAIVTDTTDATYVRQKPRHVGRAKLEIPRMDENGPWHPQDSRVLSRLSSSYAWYSRVLSPSGPGTLEDSVSPDASSWDCVLQID